MLDEGIAAGGEDARRAEAKRLILENLVAKQNGVMNYMQAFDVDEDMRYSRVNDDLSNLVLAEFSDMTIIYNPGGEWEYSMMEVSGIDAGPRGQPTTEAVMDRPLNGFR